MKKTITIVFALATMFSFAQCTNSSADKLCSNADTRAKVITELMDNDAYMKEIMIAMKVKHGAAIASTSCDMMKDDKAMGTKMMGSMMDMCMADTAMCKMMMGKTMEMCDMDKSKCIMMMGSMKQHPKSMQSMKDMGMCDM
jgi:anaerobic selenocysteine-containing dehydrogenase